MATILVVDDTSATREPLVALLRAQGHQVLEAADGREGLATFTAFSGASHVLAKPADCQERTEELGHALLEHTRAAEALQGSEIQFRRLFEAARDGILILDAETGEITAVNPFLADLLGYGRQEIIGKKLWEIAPFKDTKASKIAFHELQSQEYIRYDDLPLEARDGRSIAVEFVSNVYDVDRKKVIQCNIRDITERKRAEAELGLQSAALNAAADAIVITDRVGLIVWVNPAFSDLTGYAAAEAVGRNMREVGKSGQHDSAFYKNLWDTILSGQVWRGEIINRRRDNSLYTEEQAITPVRDEQGEIRHFIAVKQDITDRNRAAEAVRIAEERMRFALQSADVGIWDMDFTTGVLQWSEILETQYGLQPGTFGGTFEAFVDRVHPEDRDALLETMAKANRSGTDFSVSNRAIWPDGTVRWLNGAGRIYLGEHGEPVRGVGISLDVTDRRTLEAQFYQSQKMEAVGRLAGGVAHDFNNLLTAILGYCELLLADFGPDDPRKADIAEIHKAGTSAAALTRQLLAFSRKQIIEPTLLDLNVVVADMRPMLGRLIREDVKVVLGLQPGLAPVVADRAQVEQIVLNLAVNARDAMPRGGRLTIETANVELDELYPQTHFSVKPGPYVVLTVTDTGAGMTPQVQARLFEPFFTTKEPGRGTGLGLATVHGIVTRFGGSVNVYSEVGRGTSFKVYLPRADVAELALRMPPPVAQWRPRTETVLVVEDAEGIRDLARRLLERQGYTVLVAATADDALRLFEQNASIDVLLTDVVMPGASGPELTRRLVEQRPGLKVIYMSGYTEEAIVHHGVLDPGIAFLHKPFTSETLGRKIAEVLDRDAIAVS